MKKVNVLVTAVGGPTGLGILQCLKDVDYVNIIGTDIKTKNAGLKFCDKFYSIPKIAEKNKYIACIKNIIEKEKIDVLFPTLQDEIKIYREFQNNLDCIIAIPSSDNFDSLIDKEKLYKHLESVGLIEYLPRYYTYKTNSELRDIIEKEFSDDDYVCVKDVSGHGGLGFAILTNRENYIKSIKTGNNKVYNIDDYLNIEPDGKRIVMEFLDGEEYSVDLFLHEGKTVVAVPRRRNRVSNGIVIDGVVEHNKEIIQAASKVASAIATDGFLNLQFINSADGYKLTDVNARFCGSQVMSYGAGVNFPLLFIQYRLLNEFVKVSPIWNTQMIRYWENCFFYD